MAELALGNVTSASTVTGSRATSNRSDPAAVLHCQALQFQALSTNSGSVYICDRETPNLTLDVLAEIPAPNASPATRPAWTIGNPASANAFNAADFWIVPAVADEGVRVTIVRT